MSKKKTTHTETLNYAHFQVHEEQASRIRKGFTHSVTHGMKCPRCDLLRPIILHGQTVVCDRCGLVMTVVGNALDCSTTTPLPPPKPEPKKTGLCAKLFGEKGGDNVVQLPTKESR